MLRLSANPCMVGAGHNVQGIEPMQQPLCCQQVRGAQRKICQLQTAQVAEPVQAPADGSYCIYLACYPDAQSPHTIADKQTESAARQAQKANLMAFEIGQDDCPNISRQVLQGQPPAIPRQHDTASQVPGWQHTLGSAI